MVRQNIPFSPSIYSRWPIFPLVIFALFFNFSPQALFAQDTPSPTLTGNHGEIFALSFSPDGYHVLSAGKDGSVRIWDKKSEKKLAVFTEHHKPIWPLALTAHDHTFGSVGRDRIVRIRTPETTSKTTSRRVKRQPEVQERDGETGPPPSPPPIPKVRMVIQPHEVKPGQRLKVHLIVKNTGMGPLYRFQALTHSPDPLFDKQLLYFGKIDAGQRKSESITIMVPDDFSSSQTEMDVSFKEFNGFNPDLLHATLTISGAQRPRLAYNYKILDDGSGKSVGNGDGRMQKGEAVDLLLTLRNVGIVPAPNTWAELTNAEGQHLKIRPHMVRFGALKPHESKQVRINFTVEPNLETDHLQFKLLIQEKTQQVFLNENLQLPLDGQPAQSIIAVDKQTTVTDESATVLSGAGSDTSVIASISQGQTLSITGELGDWYRVQLSDQETGWIAKAQVSAATLAKKNALPVPTIQDLEHSKEAQFITLTGKLKASEIAQAQMEENLEQRREEVDELREKVKTLTASQAAKVSPSQQESEQEYRERKQAAKALKEQEQEMEQLRAKLDSMAHSQSTEISTMQEELEREQSEREQAEEALLQFRGELQQLRSQLDEYTSAKAIKQAPPAIALATHLDGKKVKVDRIQLTGAAASEMGISRIEIRVNNELLVRRQVRGVQVVGNEPSVHLTMEFSESVHLREGKNEITVTAFDDKQLSTIRTLNLTRLVDKGKIWAVVIGISQYEQVPPLKYADKDAIAFYDYLHTQVGVPKDQITLLANNQATLFNLKRSLGTELKRKAGPQDTVIIYYAGHGAPETDSMSPDGDGLEKYLIPFDADPKDLYSTGLPMREVETIFRRLSADRVILITDSCYSGATAGRTFSTANRRAVVSDKFLGRLAKGKGRVILTASRAGEVSEERDNLQHGVFTYYLLQGLKGAADYDADGLVTVDEVYSYVSTHVPQVTGQNQHPVKKGVFEGQLILGRVQSP